MMNKKVCIEEFKSFCDNYGFSTLETKDEYILVAKDTSNEDVNWIAYNFINDTVSYLGNTDHCNIWLYDTRKDFTPKKTIEFISNLNQVLLLEGDNKFSTRDLIDPEDWQEIACINNAYSDTRY